MAKNNEQKLMKRLREKIQLSREQINTITDWLSKNKDKKVPFSLMLEKDVEMPLESGIVKEKDGFDAQRWAWNQIQEWMDKQDQSNH